MHMYDMLRLYLCALHSTRIFLGHSWAQCEFFLEIGRSFLTKVTHGWNFNLLSEIL